MLSSKIDSSLFEKLKPTSDVFSIEDEQSEAELEQDVFEKPKPKKRSRRPRDRYDSVYRSLLRRFRKFFNNSFDKATNYKVTKRHKKPMYFLDCIADYVAMTFIEHYSEDLIFSLASLIYPNFLVKNMSAISKVYQNLKKFMTAQKEESCIQVNDILLNFTFAKMELLLSKPEYALLFRYFAQENQNSFNEGECFAIEQMLTIGDPNNLLASPPCPSVGS